MKKFLTTTLPAIALLAGATFATNAMALEMHNCTGVGIRVHIYNEGDVAMVIGKGGGAVDPGKAGIWNVGTGGVKVRVFQQGIFDNQKLIQNGLAGNGNYSVGINRSNGQWSVVSGNACG